MLKLVLNPVGSKSLFAAGCGKLSSWRSCPAFYAKICIADGKNPEHTSWGAQFCNL